MIEKQASILIVTDEPGVGAACRSHLMGAAGRRYRIQQAGAGEKALALLWRRAFDCVLLDLRWLDLKELRPLLSLLGEAGDSPCGVVLLTSAADLPRAVEAMKAGAHDYLEKELITPELLRRTVANAIEKAALLGELDRMRREMVTARMLRDAEGRPLRTVTAVQDITDRKRFEQSLRQSESQLRMITNALPALVSYVDAKQRYIFNNQKYEEWLGHSPDEIKGRSLKDVFGKPGYQTIRPHVETVLNGQAVNFEREMRYKDGISRWANVSYIPDFGERGEVKGFVALVRDISERRRAEEELRASLEFNRRVLESSADCIKTLTLDGRLISMNASGVCALEIDDLRPYLGESWIDFWEGEARVTAREAIKTAAAGGVGRFTAVCKTMKGTPKWWESVISPMLNERGKPERLVAISRDITEQKRIEEERQRLLTREQSSREQAESANRLKDEFLATVSHELRAPLNAMLGWMRVLKKGGIDEETQSHALEVIERSVRIQQNLIEDLIDMARIKSGKLKIEAKPVNLAGVIEAAADIVRPAAVAKEIELNLVIESDEVVTGDHQRLQQVVWNLLSNAVKFTPQGGRVEAKLKRAVRSVQIIVCDTGRGIKSRDLPLIFDRFRQADGSSARRYGGLGVGLALVKHLIELHGGTVDADSHGEGLGSTFTINLPVRAVRGERESGRAGDGESGRVGEGERRRAGLPLSPSPALPLSLSLAGLWTLVVDDEADARELVTMLLRQYGARVTATASVAEALVALRQGESGKRPDVIISDISMPGEDGYMLMRCVRQLPPEEGGRIPAVALTAFERASDRVRALSAGFQFHVPKPVEPEELAMVIANLTGLAEKGMNA